MNEDKSEVIAQPRPFLPDGQCTVSDLATVLLYHILPFTIAPLVCAAVFLQWTVRIYGYWPLAAFFTACALSLSVPPYFDPALRRRLKALYKPLARYAKSAKFLVPTALAPEKPYILAFHPHGRMFYTATMAIQLGESWRGSFLPKGDIFMAAAGSFFYAPFLRNIFYALGLMPASRGDIQRKLQQGNHVGILVGGVKEVLLGTYDNVDILYLQKRKGFIKIAIEQKAGVIPVYCFNENQLFKHDPKWLLQFWAVVDRYVAIGAPFMRGIWNTPLPYRRDILCAFGEPLFPSEGETVDAFHARYVQAVRALFEKYVGLSARPKQRLEIV